jgi:hypothetical protein
MMTMVFSNSHTTKQIARVVPNGVRKHTNIVNTGNIQNAETIYYMKNGMIGRLMNSAKCARCPKH